MAYMRYSIYGVTRKNCYKVTPIMHSRSATACEPVTRLSGHAFTSWKELCCGPVVCVVGCVVIVSTGKLTAQLVHIYNMHPHIERANYSKNCAYYTRNFTNI